MFYFSHNTFYQCGLTFAVLAYESHFVASLYSEVGILEHDMVAVCLSYVLHNHRIIAGARRGREFQPQCRSIFFVHFQKHQLFQHLDAALHLQGFGIGSLEALDEFFGFGDELLLVVVCLLLLFAPLFAELQVFGVVYFIVVDSSHGHFNGTGRDVVYKFAVVADDDDGFPVVDKKLFQPLDGLDVEVVGRLVQQQYVRFLQQQFGKLDAHAPATAEIACLAVEVLSGESEAEQCLFNVLFVIGGVDGIKLLA